MRDWSLQRADMERWLEQPSTPQLVYAPKFKGKQRCVRNHHAVLHPDGCNTRRHSKEHLVGTLSDTHSRISPKSLGVGAKVVQEFLRARTAKTASARTVCRLNHAHGVSWSRMNGVGCCGKNYPDAFMA
jgi:hypothetical protein